MKKAILVTGSNGEIGSQLLASMQDNNITKIALDINESITNYDNTIYIKDSITNSKKDKDKAPTENTIETNKNNKIGKYSNNIFFL